jgi:cob(I)alamin adenosyltransferase
MTRRAKKTKLAKKSALRKRAIRKSKPRRKSYGDLDAMIAAASLALELKNAKPWMASVAENLHVIIHHGAQVTAFPLPDDIEPAPVFEA